MRAKRRLRASQTSASVFPRVRYLAAAAVLGVALAIVPSVANSEPAPTVKAVETSLYSYSWSPSEVAVSPGGEVTFANSTAGVPHGIVWTSPAKPNCAASVPDGEGGKEASSSSSWTGSCTFAAAGAYTFRCYVHPYMTGTITVSGSGTTTTGTTTPITETAPTTSTSTGPPPPASEGPLLAGSAAHALSLPQRQRGRFVRGSIDLSKAAAGGRLEIDLLASRASLSTAHHSALVPVGRLARTGLRGGELHFAVSLNKRGLSALRRHHRLMLVVKITIAGVAGKPLTIARSVLERV